MAGELSSRGQRLLKLLVERYIREGQPVGSKALLEESGLPISPATVRNIMADLEERGYVRAPHTSAGRVPTVQGYRLFVDALLTMRPLEEQALLTLRNELSPDRSPKELIQTASSLLASITAQAGLVSVPRNNRVALRQVEFLSLSDNRVLVILVLNEREVQNRVIHTQRNYSQIELTQAANMINQRFAGRSLDDVRIRILAAMRADKASIDRYLQATLDLAAQAFATGEESEEPDYVVAGEARLVESTPPEELDKLRGLFDAFQQKKDILELVDRCLKAEGVKIFIGEEAGFEVLGDFSVITAPYEVGGQSLGVLGVIGPTRMAYERVIPIVDITARMLSAALRNA